MSFKEEDWKAMRDWLNNFPLMVTLKELDKEYIRKTKVKQAIKKHCIFNLEQKALFKELGL